MKTLLIKAAASLVIVLTILGCTKVIERTYYIMPVDVNSRLTELANLPTQYTINANSFQEITAPKGTKVYFPARAFVTQSGQPVSGQVAVEVLELFSLGDMILNDKMTVSNGQILASGGELFFEVTQNGKRLELAPGAEVRISVPTTNASPNMALFTGTTANGNFAWVPNNTPVTTRLDSIANQLYYDFGLDTLFSWVNCDYFYNDPRPLTEVEIQTPTGYNGLNTAVYVYIPSISSVCKPNQVTGSSFFINGGYKLPEGLQVAFVGVHHDGTDFYVAYQSNTIVQNHVEVLSFQKVTEAQLLQILQNL